MLPERYQNRKAGQQQSSNPTTSTDLTTTTTSTAVAVPTVSTSSPGSCPELTKELIASFAQQGTIMLTVSGPPYEAVFDYNIYIYNIYLEESENYLCELFECKVLMIYEIHLPAIRRFATGVSLRHSVSHPVGC